MREKQGRVFIDFLQYTNDILYSVKIKHQTFAEPINFVNAKSEELLGYSSDDFIHSPSLWFKSIHPQDLDTVIKTTQKIFETKEPIIRVYRFRHGKTGKYVYLEDKVVPKINHQGQITDFIGVARDITERKIFEIRLNETQKMKIIGQLAGGVAHDFNNILSIIHGNIKLIEMSIPSEIFPQEKLEKIYNAINSASALTGQILNFSRKQVPEISILNVNDIIENSIVMLERLIGKNIEFEADLNKQESLKIKACQGQIEQLLTNLIINAKDAMPNGGRITIKTIQKYLSDDYFRSHGVKPKTGTYILIEINDNGFGMTLDTISQLFTPYFTTKEEGKGNGIGLAIVYRIVKQNNGYIWTHSEIGKGTTFRIYFPRQ